MINDVIKFNKVRNGFKLDSDLEGKMMTEEAQEFFDAETLAERIDAYIDFKYVWLGTQCKLIYNGSIAPEVVEAYSTNTLFFMRETLIEYIRFTQFDIDEILEKAEKIVCECNALKISKLDENGKVMKQDDLPDATELINDMLDEFNLKGYEV